jgi:hypothetical protein
MKRSYNTMKQFFLGCFWNLWAMNSTTQFHKYINYLSGKGEHRGLDLSPRCFLLPSYHVSTRSTRFHCPNRSQPDLRLRDSSSTSIVLLHVTSCSLSSCASTNFYETRPLLSPVLVVFMCPRCQMVDTWCIVRHITLIKLENLLNNV